MTIPPSIVDFLNGATIAVAGTRDAEHVPHVHRPTGWSVSPDGSTIACLFPESLSTSLIGCLEQNGEIALTVSEAPSHETYQLKGKFVRSEPLEEEDRATYRACRERAAGSLSKMFGLETQAIRDCLPSPTVKVVFDVREIFDQTPGPDAGRRL